MQIYWAIGFVILALTFVYDRKVLQFDPTAFLRFLRVLALGLSLSVVLNLLVGRFPPLPPVGFGSLFMVWWEDMLFGVLLIYYAEMFLPRWLFVPVVVLSSLWFGAGHLYQGWFVALLLSLYPYFISYKFGKKYGFGTVMVAHVVYDLAIVSSLIATRYLHNLIN